MAKALIFGANGQDGFYLSRLLKEEGVEVVGVSRSGVQYIEGDVSNWEFVESHVKAHQPDYIFHFAANSTTRHDVLFENHAAISTGTLNVLEGSRLHCPKVKVFLSGSAMQFENKDAPIHEHTPFDASSPYSVARIHSVYAGRYYRSRFGLQVYVGYFFNHDSPLRTERHVNKKITAAVKRIANGSRETLEIGNIDVQKEFNYAGDVVQAVWLLVNQAAVSEAVIGSGKPYSIKDWLSYCFAKYGLNWQEHVSVRSNFVSEYQVLVSDPALIHGLGWRPGVEFSQLADLMLGDE